MTDERAPFEPIGDVARKQLILDGIDRDLPPLEPLTFFSDEMISEWLGEPFPIRRQRHLPDGELVTQLDYGPMEEVRAVLLAGGVLLLRVEGRGYQVATDAESVASAEGDIRRSVARLARAGMKARVVGMGSAERRRADDLERDAREAARVLRHQMRDRRRNLGLD